ncbi:MAG TPA: glycosyltransferase 87 family protein [Acidimicrobiales bacterium]|nr:glycosyltransferase 87 family protein [Acidimicrobiales bacterium]
MPARLAALVATGTTAAVLLRGKSGSLGPNMVLLTAGYVALAVIVVVEVRRHRAGLPPGMGKAIVAICAAGLLVLAVAAPPTESGDVWAYAWYGRVVAHYHSNPYTTPPSHHPDDKWARHVDRPYQHSDSVYGPAFTAVSGAGMLFFGFSFLSARLFFQLLAAACVAAVMVLVWRRTRSPAAVAIIGLNPLVIVSVVNGGHNDAWVGLAVLAGVLLVTRDRLRWAGLAFAVAVMVKVAAVLPLLAVGVWLWRKRGWRAAAEMGAAAAVAGLVGYGIAGGTSALGPLRAAQLHFSGPSVWKGPERWLGGHGLTRWIATTATATVVALVLFLSRRRLDHADPAVVAGSAVLVYCLLGPYVLPWYVFWGLGAFALAWRSRLAWLALFHGAVLHLAYVPDPEIHGQPLDPLFARSPVQRFQLDLFQMWVPLLELVIIVAVIVYSLRPSGEPEETGSPAPNLLRDEGSRDYR